MPKRASPRDAARVETADDLEDVVSDKRAGWRANGAAARRRQRRYKKRLTDEVARRSFLDPDALEDDGF